ncbi:MAG: 3-hydroxybutyryl-CoA dehydrogenase, partial [Pedobacter sp.]
VLEQAAISIRELLSKAVAKHKLTNEQALAIIDRIHFSNTLQEVKADLCIEAIIEKPAPKIELFNQLAAQNDDNCILASNTSSLSITILAQSIPFPKRVAGLHFFNPATLMKLVEVVKGNQTSNEVTDALTNFIRKTGKTPVTCIDSPGFIVNRVARPYYIEALRLVEEGLATIEQVDAVMEQAGFKLGPFKLMDLIGNDINYAVSESVYEQMNKPERLKPSFIQKEKVDKKELGRKTGKGYYDYE